MHIIKLDAIDSTNSFLRQLSAKEPLTDYTVVVADHQTSGRGQMGTNWVIEGFKNLTISVFKDISFLSIENNFYISMASSLAVFNLLKGYGIKKLHVKWPNDILSGNKKLAGILIENVIKQQRMHASIIGIGLNVNQTVFDNLPNATSLKLVSDTDYDLDSVLSDLINLLQYNFDLLEKGQLHVLKAQYETYLFKKGITSTFKDISGKLFNGIILGVSESGNLRIQTEDDLVKEFNLKTIKLLY